MKSMPLRIGSPFESTAARTSSRRRSDAQKYWFDPSLSATLCLRVELRGCSLLRAFHDIRDAHLEHRIDSIHLYQLNAYEVAQVLLERALHKELHGSGKLGTRWSEGKLLQAAPECRAINPFARPRQHKLFDEIAYVIVIVGHSGAFACVEVKWKVDVHTLQIAVTRVCVTVMINGVPFGAHIA